MSSHDIRFRLRQNKWASLFASILLTATWIVAHPAIAATGNAAVELSGKQKAALETAFARADVNSDGKLSREEASRLPVISAKFDELDVNHDDALSLGEFAVGYNAEP